MLTEEEIQRLLDYANHPRDRALIAVLWETGCRAGEILTLRLKSFKENDDICCLDVDGKTGSRRIPIVASVPHLTKWLTFHPYQQNPESPMWIQFSHPRKGDSLSYGAFSDFLRKLAKKAGINKRVHAHLFRHSRATFLAKHLTEAQMKQFFGWTQGSEMASTYVHLSGRDIQDSILKIYGKKSNNEREGPKITTINCARCGFENANDSRFCGRCGTTVSYSETVSLSQKLQIYDDLLNALLSDDKIVKALGNRLNSDKELARKLKQLLKDGEVG
jgi:integrase/recombinase XerD